MAAPANGPQSSRIVRRVILGLALVLIAILAVPVFDWVRSEMPVSRADEERLRVLETAPLPVVPVVTTGPQDWPQWRGANRDGISTESGLWTDWGPSGPEAIWRAKTGMGFSSLAVAQGRAYSLVQDGENEVMVCWDADRGTELWRYPYPTPVKYVSEKRSGPRSTPTVADGKVYGVGSSGLFFCLDALSGALRWQHDLLKEYKAPSPQWGVAFSPLVVGDLVYTCPGGPAGCSIVAFDKNNGKEASKALDDAPSYSSPIVVTAAGRPQLLVLTGKALVSVSPTDGTLYWRYEWPVDFDANAATPTCAGNYVFISSNYGKGCAMLEIVPHSDGSLKAQMVYENNRMKNHFSSCVLYQDNLYGFDDIFLVCLSFRTGKVRWKERGFGKGSLLLVDGQLIVLGEEGKVAVAAATPEAFQVKSTFQFSENRCLSAPVLAHGKLYLRDESELVCFRLKKP